jgi:hypothetical protein
VAGCLAELVGFGPVPVIDKGMATFTKGALDSAEVSLVVVIMALPNVGRSM